MVIEFLRLHFYIHFVFYKEKMPSNTRKHLKKGSRTQNKKRSTKRRGHSGGGYILPMEYFGAKGSHYFPEGSSHLTSYAPRANDVINVSGQENMFVDANGSLYAGQNLVPGGPGVKTLMMGGGKGKGKGKGKSKSKKATSSKGKGKNGKDVKSVRDVQKRFA